MVAFTAQETMSMKHDSANHLPTHEEILFSSVDDYTLRALGVGVGLLQWNSNAVDHLVRLRAEDSPEIENLGQHFEDIYYLHMYRRSTRPGRRMMLDAIFLTVIKLALKRVPQGRTTVYDNMRPTTGHGVTVRNPQTGYGVHFEGCVDHFIAIFDGDGRIHDPQEAGALKYALGMMILFKRKDDPKNDDSLNDYMPVAMSQAMAVCEAHQINQLRFCISDGEGWIFSICSKNIEGFYHCHRSTTRELFEPSHQIIRLLGGKARWLLHLHELVELVYYWLLGEEGLPKQNLLPLFDMLDDTN